MKVHVDSDNCEAQGICVRTCPQIFNLDDADTLHIAEGDVPPDLVDHVRRAVQRCPKQALRIED